MKPGDFAVIALLSGGFVLVAVDRVSLSGKATKVRFNFGGRGQRAPSGVYYPIPSHKVRPEISREVGGAWSELVSARNALRQYLIPRSV